MRFSLYLNFIFEINAHFYRIADDYPKWCTMEQDLSELVIDAAMEALQVFGEAVNATGADHEVQMRAAMDRLTALAGIAGLNELREGIGNLGRFHRAQRLVTHAYNVAAVGQWFDQQVGY